MSDEKQAEGPEWKRTQTGAAAVLEDLQPDSDLSMLLCLNGETLVLEVRKDGERIALLSVPSMAMGTLIQGLIHDQSVRSRAVAASAPSVQTGEVAGNPLNTVVKRLTEAVSDE